MANDLLSDIPDAGQQTTSNQNAISNKDLLPEVTNSKISTQQSVKPGSVYGEIKDTLLDPHTYASAALPMQSLMQHLQIPESTLSGAGKFGQGLHNAPYNIATYAGANPQNIPQSLQPNDTNFDQLLGINPTPVTNTVSEAVRYSPYVLAAPAGIVGSTIAGAIGGATQNTNPLEGGLIGAGSGLTGGLATEYGPAAFGAGKNLLNDVFAKSNPEDTAQSLMQMLGKGRSLQENAAMVGSKIQDSFENNVSHAKANYGPVFNELKNDNIYDPKIDNPSSYSNLKDISDSYLPNTKDLHDTFLNNPTLQNAHNLQSQLGYEIRDMQGKLSKGTLDRADQITLQRLNNARGSLMGDVNSYLSTKDSTGMLSKLFDNSTKYYAENVAPYKNNPLLSQISNGTINNPQKIMSSMSSILKNENIDKIASDIGQGDFQDMIAYHKLGGNTQLPPEKLLSKINDLQNKSPEFVSPNLSMAQDKLSKDILAQQAKKAAIKKVVTSAGVVGLAGIGGDTLHHLLGGL